MSKNISIDDALHKALRHPLRREILKDMAGRESTSPKEISDRLGRPLSRLSYHIRVLAKYEAIKLIGTRPVRGSMEHFYRFDIEASWALDALRLTPPPSAD